MGIGLAQSVHAEKVGADSSATGTKNQGTLKTEGGKEHVIIAFGDTESVTEAVNQFLQEACSQKRSPDALLEYVFVHITPELVEIEAEIAHLQNQLASQGEKHTSEQPQTHSSSGMRQPGQSMQRGSGPLGSEAKQTASGQQTTRGEVFTSLFSLARTFNSTLASAKKEQSKNDSQMQGRLQGKEEVCSPLLSTFASPFERLIQEQSRFEREGGGQQGQKEHDDEQEQKRGSSSPSKKKRRVGAIGGTQAAVGKAPSASRESNASHSTEHASPQQVVGSVENIYIRFMALMARILGQAEREAHELYLRIKERTDNVDVLTLLLSKINSEKGAIDLSQK